MKESDGKLRTYHIRIRPEYKAELPRMAAFIMLHDGEYGDSDNSLSGVIEMAIERFYNELVAHGLEVSKNNKVCYEVEQKC